MNLISVNGELVRRDRFIRLNETEHLAGIRKSTIYALMKQEPPGFPRCVQISPRCVAWSYMSVLGWIEERKKAALDSKAGVE